ncbi:unnamed protein product [Symbiodinium natans]|uniref:Uncharacterized protein n=1 Tax=Symbiodinium natans TaxID=878477 RepID=A0A812TX79_9DINO|nr:unnamed protein product [Symbiodinium natans]
MGSLRIIAMAAYIARLCADGPDSLSHALLECVAYSQPRQRWRMQTRSSHALSLETPHAQLHTDAPSLRWRWCSGWCLTGWKRRSPVSKQSRNKQWLLWLLTRLLPWLAGMGRAYHSGTQQGTSLAHPRGKRLFI